MLLIKSKSYQLTRIKKNTEIYSDKWIKKKKKRVHRNECMSGVVSRPTKHWRNLIATINWCWFTHIEFKQCFFLLVECIVIVAFLKGISCCFIKNGN